MGAKIRSKRFITVIIGKQRTYFIQRAGLRYACCTNKTYNNNVVRTGVRDISVRIARYDRSDFVCAFFFIPFYFRFKRSFVSTPTGVCSFCWRFLSHSIMAYRFLKYKMKTKINNRTPRKGFLPKFGGGQADRCPPRLHFLHKRLNKIDRQRISYTICWTRALNTGDPLSKRLRNSCQSSRASNVNLHARCFRKRN